jgi:cytochrome P450
MDYYLRHADELEQKLTFQEMEGHARNWLWGSFDSTRFIIGQGLVHSSLFPDAKKRVREEMIRVCGPSGTPSASQLERTNTPQLHAFVAEILRLFPPFPFGMSKLLQPVTFGSVVVPAGATVSAHSYATQRDPTYW